jgi:hypothetical protein
MKNKNVLSHPRKLSFAFPKKEWTPNEVQLFSSANPACSLRFPIAATQAKLIESKNLCLFLKYQEPRA